MPRISKSDKLSKFPSDSKNSAVCLLLSVRPVHSSFFVYFALSVVFVVAEKMLTHVRAVHRSRLGSRSVSSQQSAFVGRLDPALFRAVVDNGSNDTGSE